MNPVNPANKNVPIVQCILAAWVFFTRNLQITYLYGMPFIATSILSGWIGLFVDPTAPLAALGPLLAMMSLMFLIMMDAALYRLALGLPAVGLGGLNIGADEFRLAVVNILVGLVAVTIAVVVAILIMFMISPILTAGIDPELLQEDASIIFAEGGSKVWLTLGLAAAFIWAVLFYLMARFALAFPTAISEKAIQIFEAAAWTKGQGIRIAIASIIAFAPVYILMTPELIGAGKAYLDGFLVMTNKGDMDQFAEQNFERMRSNFHWQILAVLLAPALNSIRVGLFTALLRGLRPAS